MHGLSAPAASVLNARRSGSVEGRSFEENADGSVSSTSLLVDMLRSSSIRTEKISYHARDLAVAFLTALKGSPFNSSVLNYFKALAFGLLISRWNSDFSCLAIIKAVV